MLRVKGADNFPDSLILGAHEVHLWQATLDDHSPADLSPLLSEDEAERARRFHFEKDKNHYTVARGLLRRLLAAYLDSDPADLQFAYADKGKPFLGGNHRDALNFNLAHSQGMAIYAFSRGRELGVDLEGLREDFGGEKIAARFFSPHEINELRKVPEDLKTRAFFNCWTRKEAYIKARGEGLSMPLDEFDVSLAPGEPAAFLGNHKDAAEILRWSMQSVTVAEGYVAALVVEGHDWQLQSFSLDPK